MKVSQIILQSKRKQPETVKLNQSKTKVRLQELNQNLLSSSKISKHIAYLGFLLSLGWLHFTTDAAIGHRLTVLASLKFLFSTTTEHICIHRPSYALFRDCNPATSYLPSTPFHEPLNTGVFYCIWGWSFSSALSWLLLRDSRSTCQIMPSFSFSPCPQYQYHMCDSYTL